MRESTDKSNHPLLFLEFEEQTAKVWFSGRALGHIHLYGNAFHSQNCYLDLALNTYDPSLSRALFEACYEHLNRPLQVMLDLSQVVQADFLLKGGFVRKRRCYEAEVSLKDYAGPGPSVALLHTRRTQQAYEECTRLLYTKYIQTHRDINPLTASFSDFCDALPEEVFYLQEENALANAAFVERNEIAYIIGERQSTFQAFAASLIHRLFEQHGTLIFECDDCDDAAMALRALFIHQKSNGLDTYVFNSPEP